MNFSRLTRRLRYWLDRDARRRRLQEEMEHHIELLAQDFIAQGMTESGARAAARRKFGNTTLVAEDSRAVWIFHWLSDATQDLRYAARNLRRDAGFTTFAVLIVGLGIGASSTVYSVVNALLVRPLPFRDPAGLVWLANEKDPAKQSLQVDHLRGFLERSRTVADLAGYFAFYGAGDLKLTGDGEPVLLTGVKVTQNFFPLLGVQPLIGRNFTAEECRGRWLEIPAVLLSFSLWKARFASDPAIAGRQIILNGAPATVAGVLPSTFDLADVFAPGARIDLYLPFPLTQEANRQGDTLAVVGRLRPGVRLDTAQKELTAVGREIERQPTLNEIQPRLSSLEQHVNGRFRLALLVLVAAVAVVMLIVCANLSNLQLARTASRRKEMAVRVALGAGRQRLIRQMLTESVALSSGGAALGLILAIAGTRLVAHLDAISIPLLASVRLDPSALLFTLSVAVLTGILFGLAPALQVPALAVNDALRDGSRGLSDSRKRSWIRGALAVSEVALACVLVVGAGLLIRSFLHVLSVDPGFRPESVSALRVDPSSRYSTQALRNNYYSDVLRSVRTIPGITGAGLTDVLPLGGNRGWAVCAQGEPCDERHFRLAFVRVVAEGYFHAMGIPLKAGRVFTERDTAGSPPVIIINETFARSVWPNQNAVGQTLRILGQLDREVVGVVGDVRHQSLEQGSGNEMYEPIRQDIANYNSVELVVRSSLPPAQLAPAVRAALMPVEPELPANQFRSVQALVDKAVSPRRFIVVLLSGFSAFALILSALGIYGVISYSVSQRIQEIGIRMALGASSWNVERGVLLKTLGLAALGIGIGIAASWMLTRAIRGLLFGVSATDPVTFLGTLGVLTAAAAIAGYLPARRAARVDPIGALRAN